jgi:hypothetical protein
MDDIKALWRQGDTGGPAKTPSELEAMVRVKSRATFLRTSRKLIIESLAFGVVLFACLTGLASPLSQSEATGLLIAVVAFGIVNNLVLLRVARPAPPERSIRDALTQAAASFRTQKWVGSLFTVLYFATLFFVLLAHVQFTSLKILETVLIVTGSIGVRLWFETQLWNRQIREVDSLLGAFGPP